MFAVYGGLPANLIGYVLDHPGWVRAAVASVSGAALYFLSAHMWLQRLLTSTSRDHLLPRQFKGIADRFTQCGIVFDHQDRQSLSHDVPIP